MPKVGGDPCKPKVSQAELVRLVRQEERLRSPMKHLCGRLRKLVRQGQGLESKVKYLGSSANGDWTPLNPNEGARPRTSLAMSFSLEHPSDGPGPFTDACAQSLDATCPFSYITAADDLLCPKMDRDLGLCDSYRRRQVDKSDLDTAVETWRKDEDARVRQRRQRLISQRLEEETRLEQQKSADKAHREAEKQADRALLNTMHILAASPAFQETEVDIRRKKQKWAAEFRSEVERRRNQREKEARQEKEAQQEELHTVSEYLMRGMAMDYAKKQSKKREQREVQILDLWERQQDTFLEAANQREALQIEKKVADLAVMQDKQQSQARRQMALMEGERRRQEFNSYMDHRRSQSHLERHEEHFDTKFLRPLMRPARTPPGRSGKRVLL
uniref:Trichohyalin-plectin-homology domain-containing protein n=1 Tax=Eutreptiella gymnastica TaxID=73025 RepID=A0A7S1JGQ6_9EUGL|mmetsp:Transcript_92811/g.160783  ORF Transcript_92811/g.160783 Transcript_92811/m.160783 type:complete len:387 (+) Transcript_92811:66-1226(+)